MSPDRNAFIKATNQAWKLYLGYFILLIGAAMVFIISNYSDKIAYLKDLASGTLALLLGLGFLTFFSAIIWMCVSIKCPSCKGKLFWHAIAKRNVNDSLAQLPQLEGYR